MGDKEYFLEQGILTILLKQSEVSAKVLSSVKTGTGLPVIVPAAEDRSGQIAFEIPVSGKATLTQILQGADTDRSLKALRSLLTTLVKLPQTTLNCGQIFMETDLMLVDDQNQTWVICSGASSSVKELAESQKRLSANLKAACGDAFKATWPEVWKTLSMPYSNIMMLRAKIEKLSEDGKQEPVQDAPAVQPAAKQGAVPTNEPVAKQEGIPAKKVQDLPQTEVQHSASVQEKAAPDRPQGGTIEPKADLTIRDVVRNDQNKKDGITREDELPVTKIDSQPVNSHPGMQDVPMGTKPAGVPMQVQEPKLQTMQATGFAANSFTPSFIGFGSTTVQASVSPAAGNTAPVSSAPMVNSGMTAPVVNNPPQQMVGAYLNEPTVVDRSRMMRNYGATIPGNNLDQPTMADQVQPQAAGFTSMQFASGQPPVNYGASIPGSNLDQPTMADQVQSQAASFIAMPTNVSQPPVNYGASIPGSNLDQPTMADQMQQSSPSFTPMNFSSQPVQQPVKKKHGHQQSAPVVPATIKSESKPEKKKKAAAAAQANSAPPVNSYEAAVQQTKQARVDFGKNVAILIGLVIGTIILAILVGAFLGGVGILLVVLVMLILTAFLYSKGIIVLNWASMPKIMEYAPSAPSINEVFTVRLKLTSTNLATRMEIILRQNNQVIGRDASVSRVPVNYPGISRMHCKIHCEEKGGHTSYFVTDLDSKNGTKLNGEKLRPNESYPLQLGDTLTLAGKYSFQVESDAC